MNVQTVVVCILCATAVFVLSSASATESRMHRCKLRMQSIRPSAECGALGGGDEGAARTQSNKARLALLSCLLCGAVAWLLIGGVPGLVVGLLIPAAGPRLLDRLESRSTRTNRLLVEASAPMVADLMAACLASGASTAAATRATAEALGGPVSHILNQCVVQFNLGAGPTQVWRPLAAEPSLAPIARAILRSAETGAPLTAVLLRVADDLRLARRAQLEQAAKTVGVKAVGPLGLCFLPAFMLLGVVPLIASLVGEGLPG